MLDDADILALFGDGESDRVERKESLADRDRVREAICAFANDLPNYGQPGVVFIGQRDDLTCAGTAIDDALLTLFAGFLDDGRILPFPTMYVRRMRLDGCDVAVVQVEPSDNPPVRLDNRVWVRVGPRRARATPEEERRLTERRRWGSLPFDAQGVVGATLADLDLRRFELEYVPSAVTPEALAENRRPRELQLASLRMATGDGIPTAAGILVLGIDVRRWLPGAYIQFLRLEGTQLTDPIVDQREIGGTVADQLRQIDETVRLNIRQPAVVGGEVRREILDYPEEAIRQVVRNAVLHRNYESTAAPVRVTWFSDRIEVHSPGGPYGQVTAANFGQPGITDYRNPTLAEALKVLGFVERFGVGIAITRQRLQVNGSPPPEFVVEGSHVAAILRRRP